MTLRNRLVFNEDWRSDRVHWDGEPDAIVWAARLPNGGRITVQSRVTGWDGCPRDVETGYRSPCGKFWLASGHCDIRDCLDDFADYDDAAEWVMRLANNLIASPPKRGYRHATYEHLQRWHGATA